MFRTASRFSVMALGVVCLLAFAEPAAAQKSKSSASKAKSSRVTSKATRSVRSAVRSRSAARPSPVRRSIRSRATSRIQSAKPRINVSPQRKSFRSTPRTLTPRTRVNRGRSAISSAKPRVNVLGQDRGVRKRPRVNVTPRGSDIGAAKGRQRTSSRAELDARSRADRRSATSSFRDRSDIARAKRDVISNRASSAERSFRSRPDRDRFDRDIVSRFRERPSARAWDVARRRWDRLHRRYERYHPGYTYWNGFHDGYSFGYHRGYHVGFHLAHAFHHHHLHRHYYGTHLVLGYHYGGFGYYRNRWHFAIVIGAPVITYHTGWYGYSWWDGYGSSLVTWDRYRNVYDESYVFGDGSCVELHVVTNDRATYEIKIDPRYYDADDPGDLYAELWSELSTQGELRIQDLNGAVHIFPAGMIQQIEARPCR